MQKKGKKKKKEKKKKKKEKRKNLKSAIGWKSGNSLKIPLIQIVVPALCGNISTKAYFAMQAAAAIIIYTNLTGRKKKLG